MSLWDKLKRGVSRKEVQKRPSLSKHASEHGVMDQWSLSDLKRDSDRFRERMERPIDLGDTGPYEPSVDIHDDLFLTAHASGDSKVKPATEVRPSHEFGRQVLDAFVKTDEHRDVKPYTEGDGLSSLLYSMTAADTFDTLMADQSVREQAEQSQAQHEQEQDLGGVLDAIDGLRAQAQDAAANGQPTPDGLAEELKDLIGQREALTGQLAQAPPPGKLPKPIATAVAQAAKQGKERVDTWSAIQSSGMEDVQHVTPDEAMALTEAWMQLPDYKLLCELLGRIQRDFRAQEARNVQGGSDEVVGIELGNNLTSTLPSELARLGNPLTQRSFLIDFQDEALLQFEHTSSDRVQMGPGALCIDLSGSMQGENATKAKAVAIGFIKLMHRKQRDAVVICFNSQIVYEQHFPRRGGVSKAKELLKLAGLAARGGTNITLAVLRAEQIINSQPDFKRADVLVVTDGQSTYGPDAEQLRLRFEKTGVRRHGIAIGHTPSEGGYLLRFCDDAISVDDLTEATGDIVAAIS
jgi:uncharacterized protein with von Willebrand factor type A (vWA) domain